MGPAGARIKYPFGCLWSGYLFPWRRRPESRHCQLPDPDNLVLEYRRHPKLSAPVTSGLNANVPRMRLSQSARINCALIGPDDATEERRGLSPNQNNWQDLDCAQTAAHTRQGEPDESAAKFKRALRPADDQACGRRGTAPWLQSISSKLLWPRLPRPSRLVGWPHQAA